VYAWTKRIPKGQISTYGDIAKVQLHFYIIEQRYLCEHEHVLVDVQAMGDPQCSRAVGSALKKNPFAPQVPCHRVLKVCTHFPCRW
jgi:O6-methylguanine-DNA--protein-cysteine methyltransferase